MNVQTTNYKTITVTPSTPHVGAEISNIDLTKQFSAALEHALPLDQ